MKVGRQRGCREEVKQRKECLWVRKSHEIQAQEGLLLSPLMQVKPVPLAGASLGECR